MLRWLLRRRIAAFGRAFDYDVTYMQEMLDIDPEAARRFGRLIGLSRYRRGIPAAPWHAAHIRAALHEDCGPCVQLSVTMAERRGVPAAVLRAAFTGDLAAMPPDVALACRFADAILRRDQETDALRAQVLAQWGRRGLLSLSLTTLAARTFPALKFALGHAHSCSRVVVGGAPVARLRHAA